MDVLDVPLAYLPGKATKVKVKAVGDFVFKEDEKDGSLWKNIVLPSLDAEGEILYESSLNRYYFDLSYPLL